MKVENKTKKTVTSALFYVLYVALAVVFLAPLLFLFVSSVKSETQLVSDMATLKAFIPYGNLTLENYVAVFEKLDFLHYFRNSAVNAIIQVFVGMFINGMMGYALGMLEFRGQKLLVSLMIALTIIPTEAVIINRFMVAFNLGIINTIWALAIPNLATPMYVFLFYQHFRGMPKDLLEAAIIDGCGHVRIFTRIMLPLFGLLVLASVGANLSIRGMLDSDSTFLSTLGTILIMLFTVAIVAVGIMAFILMINRFYKNLLQDEGYVMMTLPVSIHQQIWSKLIVSTVWFAATVLVIILACCITAFDIRFMGELWREMKNIVHAVIQYNHMDVVANGAAFALEALILCILGSVSFCLRAYSAMAIGFSRPNHKGLFSVAAYIGTGVVLQILGGIVISLLNDSWLHRLLLGWEPNVSVVAGMHLGMWFLIVLELIYCAVFYFLTVYFLQKHLNLE